MSLLFTFDNPVNIGDLNSSVTVSSLKLISISFNRDDVYTVNGQAVLSLCLIDPVSRYPVNVVYQSAAALDFVQSIEAQIGAQLFAQLVADSKIPSGSLSDTADTTQTIFSGIAARATAAASTVAAPSSSAPAAPAATTAAVPAVTVATAAK